ncbi:MAG: multidrug effflux MFS transporter [Legionellales bacterium]|nr:multidrug effflux MFS transporter [Legionellales bacterium]
MVIKSETNSLDIKILLILAFFIFVSAAAMDVYIPAIPSIQEAFHTNQENMQITLSIFVLILGLGQLFSGSISDQVGRKKVLIFSGCCFILGSISCALSHSIQMLIVARIIEAVGSCGITVVTFAIARDLFDGKSLSSAYSLINCGLGLSPLIAPIIGGYLTRWFGWRSTFSFVSILGVVLLLFAVFTVKETLVNAKKISIKTLVTGYYQVLCNHDFVSYSVFSIVGMSVFFAFFSVSPFIIIKELEIPEYEFGFYYFLVGIFFICGSYATSKLAQVFSNYILALLGVIGTIFSGMIMLFLYLFYKESIISFIFPSVAAVFSCALMLASGTGGAMMPFKEQAGSATALLGALQFLICAIVGYWIMSCEQQELIYYLSLSIISLGSFALFVALVMKSFSNERDRLIKIK